MAMRRDDEVEELDMIADGCSPAGADRRPRFVPATAVASDQAKDEEFKETIKEVG